MRTFTEIRDELALKQFLDSPLGTLYFVPAAPGSPRIMVRHFDRALPARLVAPYARFLRALHDWVDERPIISYQILIEQPIEVGSDFIARKHHTYYTSTSAYTDWQDPPEPPEQLAEMRRDLRDEIAEDAATPRDILITQVLTRSLLEPTGKTFYDDLQFVVVEPRFIPEDIEEWARLEQETA